MAGLEPSTPGVRIALVLHKWLSCHQQHQRGIWYNGNRHCLVSDKGLWINSRIEEGVAAKAVTIIHVRGGREGSAYTPTVQELTRQEGFCISPSAAFL